MKVGIYIDNRNNPIVDQLAFIIKSASLFQIKEDATNADVLLSFAYHNINDIVEMSTMGNLVKQFPDKRIIFLSWFHAIENLDKYCHMFSPEKPTCILLDAKKYRILQLPVTKRDIIESIPIPIN